MGRLPKNKTLHSLPTPRSCIAYGKMHPEELADIRKEYDNDMLLMVYENLYKQETLDQLWEEWWTKLEDPRSFERIWAHSEKMQRRLSLIGAAYFQLLFEEYAGRIIFSE